MTTLCWNCNTPYEINVASCPSCGAANANVNLELAMIEAPMDRLGFTETEKAEIRHCMNTGDDLSDALFTKLYEHFLNNGEMPYGTAKARTGDPYEWIGDHMHEVL